MRTYILLILLFFLSTKVNGKDQDLKIDAKYTIDKKILIEIRNVTNDTILIAFAQEYGDVNSGMLLTFIKNKKDTLEHYFEPIYEKRMFYLPPQCVLNKLLQVWDIPRGSKKYDKGKSAVEIDFIINYCVCISPPLHKKVHKKFKFGEHKKAIANNPVVNTK